MPEKMCKCGRGERRKGQRMCLDCHREYQAEWRWQHSNLPRPAPPRSVYFVRCGDFIKIGTAGDVLNRFRQLVCSNPHELTGLAVITYEDWKKADELEVMLHRHFQSLWHHGEWFRVDESLFAFIAEHGKPWPASSEVAA